MFDTRARIGTRDTAIRRHKFFVFLTYGRQGNSCRVQGKRIQETT